MEMGKNFLCLFGVLLTARITLQASSSTSPYYVGAAVEYHPVTKGNNGTAIVEENLKNYLKILKRANDHEVDIIVFPEGTLHSTKAKLDLPPADFRAAFLPHSSFVPDPKDHVTPCKNDSSNVMQALKAISCTAKLYAMYVVVNVHEKETCANEKIPKERCNPDGHMLYNTNVVFDRHGEVIARYRKYNLFGEVGFNRPPNAELSTFRTDFDVTFGQFICFDILFGNPTLRLISEAKVTDIVFSTYWFSELPFLVATPVQSAWSYMNNVNLIASGYNNPTSGSSGSGVYAGLEGPIVKLLSDKRANALLVSKIPKLVNGRRDYRPTPADSTTYFFTKNEIPTIDGPEPVPQLSMLKDNLTPYKTELIPNTNGTLSRVLCDRGLCCQFSTDTTHHNSVGQKNSKYFRYRYAVFNGVRSFATVISGGVEVCGIISCTDDTPASCNRRFDPNDIIVHPITFNSILISGDFTTTGQNVSRMPIAMNTDFQPLNASDIELKTESINQTHENLKFSLKKSRTGIMTFAIWERVFSRDGSPTTTSSASQSSPFVFMLVILVIFGVSNTDAVNPLPIVA
ncbi:vanin-like protein 2 isoform X2 [Venturia canescens]|nr:vanin-like protein 2 isoform X2 [Venturia canescens]XP_043289521.1 vanin-like protein 2 isoform X2 [Venturia canescens]XP_043289522.1 vanin-like protein 2 isoform X2 [Venturia canescens]XP_043289523.1 vanin-like protein 2 isoform X2 [Venturia canescens]